MNRIRLMLLTVGGLGMLRPAPGTIGSLPPVIIALALTWAVNDAWVINASMVALAIIFAVICVALGPWGERHFGRKDDSSIVADEVVGQAIALLALPWKLGDERHAFLNIVLAGLAFGLFRLFDVTKPPPIHGLQKLPSGWGVLIDDVIAGMFALLLVHGVAHFVLPEVFA